MNRFSPFRRSGPGLTAFLLCTALVWTTGVSAQDREGGVLKESLIQPEAITDLERAHAIRRIGVLRSLTHKDIQRLKILIANFGGQVNGTQQEFEKIRETYKQAEENYYRRQFKKSMDLHTDVNRQVTELYKKFTAHYQEQVAKLLTDCSESMTALDFSRSAEPGLKQDVTRVIEKNQFRLRIAYNQLALAESQVREENFHNAINHYRLAKVFAINVLKNSQEDPAKAKELDEKYKVDLTDAQGRTMQHSEGK